MNARKATIALIAMAVISAGCASKAQAPENKSPLEEIATDIMTDIAMDALSSNLHRAMDELRAISENASGNRALDR